MKELPFRKLYHYECIGKFSMVPVHHVRLKHTPEAEIIITRRGSDICLNTSYVWCIELVLQKISELVIEISDEPNSIVFHEEDGESVLIIFDDADKQSAAVDQIEHFEY